MICGCAATGCYAVKMPLTFTVNSHGNRIRMQLLHCVLRVTASGVCNCRLLLPSESSCNDGLAQLPRDLLLRICACLPPRKLASFLCSSILLGKERTHYLVHSAANYRVKLQTHNPPVVQCPLLHLQTVQQIELYTHCSTNDVSAVARAIELGADARLGPVAFMQFAARFPGCA